jgi:hypothetical protein
MMRCYGRRLRSVRQALCCSSSTSPSSWSNILHPSRQSINRYSSAHHCNDQYSLFEYWLVPAGCVMKANTVYRIITNDASRRLSATRPCRPSLCILGPCRVNYSMLRKSTQYCNNVASELDPVTALAQVIPWPRFLSFTHRAHGKCAAKSSTMESTWRNLHYPTVFKDH